MSNILKVTTPVSGYENTINKQNPSQGDNLSIKNPVDPTKVMRPDQKPESNREQGFNQEIFYESNFGKFVQNLNNIPKFREIMRQMVFSGMGNLVEAGISKGMAAEIQSLFQMINLSPEELKNFLESQVKGANRLQGPMFDMLREAMRETSSMELKTGILDFLKKYNDMSSGQHILKNITGYLREMEGYMFSNDRAALHRLANKLRAYSMETNSENVRILKEEIIPFLGKYISETKNMGRIRDLISLLTLNVSRYENSNLDGVTEAFRRLMNFPSFQKRFSGMTPEELGNMFKNVDFDKAAGKTQWSDKLLSIIASGVKGEAGLENREAFLNIMNGMLTNESVYMPIMHLMLPVVLNGVPLFSEIWVDPNEESDNQGSQEKGVKLLIKFDLKEVGFFDLMMYYEKGKVDMLIHYPDNLSEHESEIRDGMLKIMKQNNLEVEYLAVEEGQKSIPVSAAFPKLFERSSSINVSI